jgi:hypothetical protein
MAIDQTIFASGGMRDAKMCRVRTSPDSSFLDPNKEYVVKAHKDECVDLFRPNYTSDRETRMALVDKVII